jgi:uncharacterized membrane protein YccC
MQNWIKEVRNFIYSYHFSTGLRTTISVVVPSVVCMLINQLPVGIVISLGALATALSDVPGTALHKRNGILIAIGLIYFTALGTSLVAPFPTLTAIWIVGCCFGNAMLLVYNNRGGNIGIGCMLIMVSIIGETPEGAHEALIHSLYILLGGVWYGFLALILWQVRPYLVVQQLLSECIIQTAQYLKERARFYNKDADKELDNIYKAVLAQLVIVNEKQESVRELLLKRRSAQQGSTSLNKSLVLMFLDVVDLQEQIMAAQTDYQALHDHFKDYNILEEFHELILQFVHELHDIGVSVAAGQRSLPKANLRYEIEKVHRSIEAVKQTVPTFEQRNQFITLTNILNNLQDMAQRIYNLHRLTRLERVKDSNFDPQVKLSSFTTSNRYDLETFVSNLTFKSHIFRHALRVSMAALTGYLLGQSLHLSRTYWILLTIVVVLKPGYGLTKARSYQRLIGTLVGALFAAVVLYFCQDPVYDPLIFVLMLICILGAYSFMTQQYTVSVIFTTPFIIFLLHFLHPVHLKNVELRVLDTAIGGTIAFLANMVLWPSWERNYMPSHLVKMVKDNRNYFEQVMKLYIKDMFNLHEYKLARKDANVSAANLMGAFQRMLSEPKSQQDHASAIYHFVVLNHSLMSHIADLANYGLLHKVEFPRPEYKLLTHHFSEYLLCLQEALEKGLDTVNFPLTLDGMDSLDKHLEVVYVRRQEETSNGAGDTPLRQEMLETKRVRDQLYAIQLILKDMKKILDNRSKKVAA